MIATLQSRATQSVAAASLRSYIRAGLARALANQALRPEDLDDFTQDALVRVIEHLGRFRGESSLRTWAMAIAMRVAFTALRRRRHPASGWIPVGENLLESTPAAASAATDPVRHTERSGLLAALRGAIEALTERQRTVVLGELRGVPTEQLAAQLGTNRNALYKVHHDARRRLRQSLLDAGFTMDDVRDELRRVSEER